MNWRIKHERARSDALRAAWKTPWYVTPPALVLWLGLAICGLTMLITSLATLAGLLPTGWTVPTLNGHVVASGQVLTRVTWVSLVCTVGGFVGLAAYVRECW